MSNKMAGWSAAAAIGLVASVHAETPQRNIAVTGCLQRDLTGAYLLTDTQVEVVDSSGSAPSTTGSVWKPKPGHVQNDVPWILEGQPDLDRYLLRRVQVTGPLPSEVDAAPRPVGTSGTIGASTDETPAPGRAIGAGHRVIVKSVRLVLASCG